MSLGWRNEADDEDGSRSRGSWASRAKLNKRVTGEQQQALKDCRRNGGKATREMSTSTTVA